jgi:hypothetical protein
MSANSGSPTTRNGTPRWSPRGVAVAALVFGPQFFPSIDPVTGTLATFATFAVGFLGSAARTCWSPPCS